MVNIVFLLLIFFMLAGRIAPAGPFPVTPPPSKSAGDLEPADLSLLVAADGRIALDGEIMTEEAVFEHIRRRIRTAGVRPATVTADGATAAGHVLKILDRLRGAGLRRVVLVAEDAR
jgi:biopolymer transport protein ExbD